MLHYGNKTTGLTRPERLLVYPTATGPSTHRMASSFRTIGFDLPTGQHVGSVSVPDVDTLADRTAGAVDDATLSGLIWFVQLQRKRA